MAQGKASRNVSMAYEFTNISSSFLHRTLRYQKSYELNRSFVISLKMKLSQLKDHVKEYLSNDFS